jgi:integrase
MARTWHGHGTDMARLLNRLTDLKVRKARAKGMYADGGGLYLRVAEGGSKQWVFRYNVNGRLRDHGMGPLHTVSLAEAREAALNCRKLRLQGIDPIEHRRASLAAVRASEAKASTFAECASAYMAAHETKWKNGKSGEQWRQSLGTYVYPIIGSLPVALIDTPQVMQVIEPIWTAKAETASRVRGRIEAILDYAKVRGYRVGENPARWHGHLDHLLPARSEIRKVKHLEALPYTEIGALMAKLRQRDDVARRALEFLILTAARLGELRDATWSEIDLTARTWTVPASRMKSGKEHRVPLSARAIAVLQGMPRTSDYVFPGRNGPIGAHVLPELLQRLTGTAATAHGCRSSFRDWCAEQTNFPREVAEMALAHAIPVAAEAAYRRGDLFAKRARLMDAWSAYCAAPASKPAASGKVLPIRAG